MQQEERYFLPRRKHNLTFKKMGEIYWHLSHPWKEATNTWTSQGLHLICQAGQPWQLLPMTKFREEGKEDKGPWLVDQIYFLSNSSVLGKVEILWHFSPPTNLYKLQCYIENSLSLMQGSLRSHRKELGHKLDTSSKWPCPYESVRHRASTQFLTQLEVPWKGYGLNRMGKRKYNCDKWGSSKGYINPGTVVRSPESDLP